MIIHSLISFHKLILANTRHETYDYEGIKIYNLPDWLLQHGTLQ